jgi:DNA mismatch endonuclease (patch repair protein)
MMRIKTKNTKPEIAVRKILSKLGAKYRLHDSKLAKEPDIVIVKILPCCLHNNPV